MSIQMLGIDYNKASVDIRSEFSFTKKNAAAAMTTLKEKNGILGCIILSTCNRMEIWVSTEENWTGNLLYELCRLKQVELAQYKEYFVERKEKEAVEHLFYLTSGLKSQILAEDQIISQVKEALARSREVYCTDNVLEVLFRMAITAGKKVKSEVVFSHGNTSAIHRAVSFFKEQGYEIKDKVCLVIGNGEMGQLAAQTLQAEGADVTVTVRQYKSGIVSIPKGCKRIHYGERMDYVPECDLVLSATASPNFTLKEIDFADMARTKPLVLIDLAVPRDIEQGLAKLEYITLYDIDSFKIDAASKENQQSMKKATAIHEMQMKEFYDWYEGKELYPRIQEIKKEAVKDLNLRIQKTMNKTTMQTKEREELLETIDIAAEKVVNKMLFGLKDSLERDAFAACIAGLEKVYEE